MVVIEDDETCQEHGFLMQFQFQILLSHYATGTGTGALLGLAIQYT